MQHQRLGQDLADRHARIERGVGVLEDDLRVAAVGAQLVGVERAEIVGPRSARVPAVGSIRRSTSRPTVDLPQPDSPTSASVSPASTAKLDAVDGAAHGAVTRPNDAAPHREMLDQACRPRAARLIDTERCSQRRADGSATAVAGRRPSTSGGGAARAGIGSTNGQRAAKRQPAGGSVMSGTHALDRWRGARDSVVEPRDRAEQADGVGMLRAWRTARRPARARRSRRHTSPRPRRQTSATTPRSWVIRMMAAPLSRPAARASGRGSAPGW